MGADLFPPVNTGVHNTVNLFNLPLLRFLIFMPQRLPVNHLTAYMEQLKKLHDEYTEKYENIHKKDREVVWKEYIQKNKELL